MERDNYLKAILASTKPVFMSPRTELLPPDSSSETLRNAANVRRVDGQGRLGLPATWLKRSLREASSKVKLSGTRTCRSAVDTGVFVFPDEVIPFTTHEEETCLRTMRMQGIVTTCERLKVKWWELPLVLMYSPSMITREQLEEVLRVAGEEIGVGTYRPQFGTFAVKKCLRVKQSTAESLLDAY